MEMTIPQSVVYCLAGYRFSLTQQSCLSSAFPNKHLCRFLKSFPYHLLHSGDSLINNISKAYLDKSYVFNNLKVILSHLISLNILGGGHKFCLKNITATCKRQSLRVYNPTLTWRSDETGVGQAWFCRSIFGCKFSILRGLFICSFISLASFRYLDQNSPASRSLRDRQQDFNIFTRTFITTWPLCVVGIFCKQ